MQGITGSAVNGALAQQIVEVQAQESVTVTVVSVFASLATQENHVGRAPPVTSIAPVSGNGPCFVQVGPSAHMGG